MLFGLLQQRAEQIPKQKAYTFLVDGEINQQVVWNYAQLDEQARTIARMLQTHVNSGERVLLLYPPGLDYVAAFWGCIYAGVTAVPAYPPNPRQLKRDLPRLQVMITDADATAVLTTKSIVTLSKVALRRIDGVKQLHWLATDGLDLSIADQWIPPIVHKDDIAFLQYTSGSTGNPKGVMLTHQNLCHNLELIRRCFNHSEESQGVIWLPPYHDMGLIGGIIQPVYGGFPVVLMSPLDFLKRPMRWLEAVSHFGGTTSGGPNFAYDLCVRKSTEEERAKLDLRSWKVAFNGAEPVKAKTMRRFSDAFSVSGFDNRAFYPCYGLAEGTLIVSGGNAATENTSMNVNKVALAQNSVIPAHAEDSDAKTFVSCGRTLWQQDIQIVDVDTGQPCPAHKIGEIWVSGPSVASGYWGDEEKTAHTFAAKLDGKTYLRTGDLGFLREGELYVTGRLKDVLIIRGRNYYPQDIEQTVDAVDEVLRPGCCAAFTIDAEDGEKVVVVQEVRKVNADSEVISEKIRQTITEKFGLQLHDIVLIKSRTIPKTSSGKIQRSRCRDRYLSGKLDRIDEGRLKRLMRSVGLNRAETMVSPAEKIVLDQEKLLATPPEKQITLLDAYLQQTITEKVGVFVGERPINSFGIDSLVALELQHHFETTLGIAWPLVSFLQPITTKALATKGIDLLTNSATTPLTVAPDQTQSALSYNQQSLWFIQQFAPDNSAYNVTVSVEIMSQIDLDRLRLAFVQLAKRHPVLRTQFNMEQGQPIQTVLPEAEIEFVTTDAFDLSDEALKAVVATAANRPFNLSEDKLWRVELFEKGEGTVMLLTLHHMIADLWSVLIMMDELGDIYDGESVSSLTHSYVDFVAWQRQFLESESGKKAYIYWEKQLAGELPLLNLPTDYSRPIKPSFKGGRVPFQLSATLSNSLNALAQAHGATLYTVLLSAFKVLLYRYTHQTDLLVGSPVTGRDSAKLSGVMGNFINPIVLRSDLSDNPTFTQLLTQLQATVLDGLTHQQYPFQQVVEKLSPTRTTTHSPVFQVLFTLQQPHRLPDCAPLILQQDASAQIGSLNVASYPIEHQTAQFDLALTLTETKDGLSAFFEYNGDLFAQESIERMVGHWETLLQSVVINPQATIQSCVLLTAEEQAHIDAWNETAVAHPGYDQVTERFSAQAAETPDAVAVVCGGTTLTYRELDMRSNQAAHHLQKLGVQPDQLVGICMDRSADMLIGLLGILKSGAAYVPLDPSYPYERLALMATDAELTLILSEPTIEIDFCPPETQIVYLDATTDEAVTAVPKKGNGNSLAYTIYTSGSTGRPKGVQIEHRTLVNFLETMAERPGLSAADRLLAVTTISFDIAALELYLPLIVGAAVQIARPYEIVDGQLLGRLLEETTIMQATPATWRLLLASNWSGQSNLKMLCGGEALPWKLARELLPKGGSLWNMYGPTETTIWSSVHEVTEAELAQSLDEKQETAVSIGHPIANTQLYILDEQLNRVPVGVTGELYIGGDGLARGYRNRPDLTSERFIDLEGKRVYHTGDIAAYRADGSVMFSGRSDHQVKVRGYRIELGEIETVLANHEAVQDVVAIAADEQLIAYWTPSPLYPTWQVELATWEQTPYEQLRIHLQQFLPDYMVPAHLIEMDEFPLTPNGKINRIALPRPSAERPELGAQYVAPSSDLEAQIATIWQAVLKREQVGVHDNFFELGGHSLQMAQVHSELGSLLSPRTVSVVDLFQYPTIYTLVASLNEEYTQNGHSENGVAERTQLRMSRQEKMKQQRARRRQMQKAGVR